MGSNLVRSLKGEARTRVVVFFLFPFSFFLFGCAYSFTGSSVPPHLKTIAIPLLDDQSGFGEAGVREEFTNTLIERFQSDNSLEIADKKDADSILEGVIISVRDEPTVVEAGETVSKRRVTITVQATYQDMKLRKKVWEKSLSNWGDYDPGSGPAQRKDAITTAIEKLSEDLLLETVASW